MFSALRFAPLLLAALVAEGALAQDLKKVDGVLVTAAGLAVYTFDRDVAGSGKSACTGACASAWPPVVAPVAVSPPYSVLTREDGTRQLAYRGKPLYRYAFDQQAGDRGGDNVQRVWHLVKD
ncbi:MAG: hypothetical protein V4754_00490 [Pseudomonadota bacterium]